MAGVVRDTAAMIAGMNPMLDAMAYVFCCVPHGSGLAQTAWPHALGLFREAEGLTLVLPLDDARGMDLPCDAVMRRITLGVASALDGVGLTAAASSALADAGIACNMIAAFHHDHVFVPQGDELAAMAALERLQESA